MNLINKIRKLINQPSDKVNPNIFIAISLIMIIMSKFVDPKIIIVFAIFTTLVMLLYIIMSIINQEDITKILIYLIAMLLSFCMIIMYYMKLKGLDLSISGIIIPIALMLLFITGYMNVKKSRDNERINRVKFSLTLAIIFFIYTLFF
ncbi:hypothetical protein SAMN02745134_02919 [Clostridium acidisoli DSM 12555]|uniref:Uncharacterized protein n=1 Tax=Clostridium acidisoli DSM 12555 TaxID=1121291 RepID=A0A1W1XRZ5_9CLOT|nr:hypothetical protein [Clostridium acidisoli]SMC26739.1 hypothetical protein SAMN02745134_02919 [Clostridium acidisoli DSM 12555]